MKKGLVIGGILTGLGVFGYALYRFYKKQFELIKQFEWKILQFKLDNVSLTNINGTIVFRFKSISDIEIVVKKFILDFYVNEVYVGWVEDTGLAEGQVIPANGYNDLTFNFTINPQLVFRDVTEILAFIMKQNDERIQLKGYVQIESGFVKTTVQINCDCSMRNLECSC